MTQYVIRAENLSKQYKINRSDKKKGRMLRQIIEKNVSDSLHSLRGKIGLLKKTSEKSFSNETFWALQDVSFNVQAGESIGVIGSNGAGKSTLLKILSRITAPTSGKVHLRGRVGSLLEVGTGFHQELTGRENVYLNGAVLGMRKKEIDGKFDEIVDFSGVEEFIDTPVKYYSSGMRMRLAFSVAAHLEPEILLVDEVLSVGDIAFQNKSLNKMEKVTSSGRTILFVSHNLAAVKSLCPQSIFLKHGSLKFMGDTETAAQMYLQDNETITKGDAAIKSWKKAQVLNITPCDVAGSSLRAFPHDKPIYVRIKVYLNTIAYKTHITLKIYNSNLETMLASHDFEPAGNSLIPSNTGTYEFQVQVPANFLTPGKYYLGAQISRQMLKNRIRPIHKLDHSAEFEVYDNGSLLSQLSVPWQGLVHNPRIKWTRLDKNTKSQN